MARVFPNLAALLAAFAIVPSAVAQTPSWDARYYNPAAAEGDVVLPMPCGGAMTFRKVVVPSNGPLDDFQVRFGSSGDAYGYAEHARTGHIAGTFGEGPGERYFLIGKYEVTALQFAALSGECPTPSNRLRLPAAEMSWYDALVFGDRYTRWLLAEAPEALPKEDGVSGFVRLPTEDEWEFAARGGVAVAESDFADTTPPMPEGMERHVWFAGSRSANGQVRFAGLLLPNPLGLHDMLGNVDEIVLDAFRMRKLSREHGQTGGYIVRGGNIFTAPDAIRSSMRIEVPHYQDGAVRRSKATGFRLAVAAPVITSGSRLREIETAWAALGTDAGLAPDAPLAGTPLEDPVDELQALAERTDDAATRARLETLRNAFRAEREARDEQRAVAARASLRLGGYLCSKLGQDGRNLDRLRESRATCLKSRGEEQCTRTYGNAIDASDRALLDILTYYADTVDQTSGLYPAATLEAEAAVLDSILNRQGLSELVAFGENFRNHTIAYQKRGRVDRRGWLEGCKSLLD